MLDLIRFMKKLKYLLLLFIALNCYSQRDDCKYKLKYTGLDMEFCRNLIVFNELTRTHSEDDDAKQRQMNVDLYVLLGCIEAIKDEKKCDKKSDYIPQIEPDGYNYFP